MMRANAQYGQVVVAPEDGCLSVLNFPGTEEGTMPWPMFQADARNSGCYGGGP